MVDVTDDVTVVTSLMTSLFVTSSSTSLSTSLLWRHYRRHGLRHYCDVTIVQRASHAHPHVNITGEFSDTWTNFFFASTQFRPNGNIYLAIYDLIPKMSLGLGFTDKQTHIHTTWSQYLSLTQSLMHHAGKEKKRIPIVSHHCHVVQNPATNVTRTDIPDRCTSSHAARVS